MRGDPQTCGWDQVQSRLSSPECQCHCSNSRSRTRSAKGPHIKWSEWLSSQGSWRMHSWSVGQGSIGRLVPHVVWSGSSVTRRAFEISRLADDPRGEVERTWIVGRGQGGGWSLRWEVVEEEENGATPGSQGAPSGPLPTFVAGGNTPVATACWQLENLSDLRGKADSDSASERAIQYSGAKLARRVAKQWHFFTRSDYRQVWCWSLGELKAVILATYCTFVS